MSNTKFTPTQLKILAVLSDGLDHKPEELLACLWDTDGKVSNVQPHITALRKLLNPQGQDIVCVTRNKTSFYRHVRQLVPIADGKRG